MIAKQFFEAVFLAAEEERQMLQLPILLVEAMTACDMTALKNVGLVVMIPNEKLVTLV